jgi:hypothetical protein
MTCAVGSASSCGINDLSAVLMIIIR